MVVKMDLKALQKISYGMYVVGSYHGERRNGQIANTVFQVASEPPTIAVSINKNNLTHEFIRASRVFSACVLCQSTPLNYIGAFGFRSGRDTDKLKDRKYRIGVTGAPLFTEYATACLEAEVTNEVDVGSHTIFIGRVLAAEVLSEELCMTYDYYHQVKRGTTPRTAPSYIASEKKGGTG